MIFAPCCPAGTGPLKRRVRRTLNTVCMRKKYRYKNVDGDDDRRMMGMCTALEV